MDFPTTLFIDCANKLSAQDAAEKSISYLASNVSYVERYRSPVAAVSPNVGNSRRNCFSVRRTIVDDQHRNCRLNTKCGKLRYAVDAKLTAKEARRVDYVQEATAPSAINRYD